LAYGRSKYRIDGWTLEWYADYQQKNVMQITKRLFFGSPAAAPPAAPLRLSGVARTRAKNRPDLVGLFNAVDAHATAA